MIDRAVRTAESRLNKNRRASQQAVNSHRHITMHHNLLAVLHLDQDVERRWHFALEDRLLRPPTPRFVVPQSHRLHPADKICQRGVHQQVVESHTVRRRNQLDAALGDRARRFSLKRRTNLVDDDYLRHMVFYRLDHDGMLFRWGRHLHPARTPNPRMRNVSITCDLVRRIHNDDAFAEVVGKHARRLAQDRGLPNARASEDQDALPTLHKIAHQLHCPHDRPTDTARQADDGAMPVPDRRDAVQRARNTRAVIVAKGTDARRHRVEVSRRDFDVVEDHLVRRKPGLGVASEVENDLHQCVNLSVIAQTITNVVGKHRQQRLDLVV
jgi:hypothetical protein